MYKPPVTIKQAVTLIELSEDFYGGDVTHPSRLPQVARALNAEITRPEVREWIEASPLSELSYTRLRWLLTVLFRSKVVSPRRLTWRERITGRLKP
jgi:hypothetical protein